MMKCIVVDDNKLARTAMIHLIGQVNYLKLEAEFDNPTEAFTFLQNENIDLVFLDVEMPGMSGLEIIRSLHKKPIIVLITAKREYAVEAFELSVADYIVKPVTLARFLSAVAKAKGLFDSKENKMEISDQEIDYIFIRNKSILIKIKTNEILYIQALGDYVTVFTTDNNYTIHITLSGIEQRIPSSKFFRLHRSYIIALDHIDHIEDGTAYVKKQAIPIGEQYKQMLLAKLNLI